ncbi:hypothetical protein F5897_000531 [Canibacter oris]|uniref:Uncharacterized protein n=1 Tax=Canibacter oris TaxID=1365628 RepID=A0A840DNW9_9MICO|nr:hypothetical protein [Canibacter oris]
MPNHDCNEAPLVELGELQLFGPTNLITWVFEYSQAP